LPRKNKIQENGAGGQPVIGLILAIEKKLNNKIKTAWVIPERFFLCSLNFKKYKWVKIYFQTK
jgi:hypothetical protein